MNGVLVIDKPGGITSHDVVQKIRKLFKTSKVGHLGTLDPMATGVLPVCIGKATRVGQFLPSSPKEYVGAIRLGFETSTYDREGTRTSAEATFGGVAQDIIQGMQRLTGTIYQTPPAYSAKKIGGEVSHKLARRGLAVENPAVEVHVDRFDLSSFQPPVLTFHVVCSGGTYVRSLAHDLGRLLGCGAHLESLKRLRSGQFSIENAVRLDNASAGDLLPMETLLGDLPLIVVDDEASEERVRHGNPVSTSETSGLARIFNKQGEFLAIASIESGWAHPRVVLTSVTSIEARKRD